MEEVPGREVAEARTRPRGLAQRASHTAIDAKEWFRRLPLLAWLMIPAFAVGVGIGVGIAYANPPGHMNAEAFQRVFERERLRATQRHQELRALRMELLRRSRERFGEIRRSGGTNRGRGVNDSLNLFRHEGRIIHRSQLPQPAFPN